MSTAGSIAPLDVAPAVLVGEAAGALGRAHPLRRKDVVVGKSPTVVESLARMG